MGSVCAFAEGEERAPAQGLMLAKHVPLRVPSSPGELDSQGQVGQAKQGMVPSSCVQQEGQGRQPAGLNEVPSNTSSSPIPF